MHLRRTPTPLIPQRGAALLACLLLTAAACSEKEKEDASPGSGNATTTTIDVDCAAVSVIECAPDGTTIDDIIPGAPIVAEGEPIEIGMINTETGPANTFPELTQGAEAGVQWINEELGGVDGHPIELHTCDAKFSATASRSCGQEMVEEGVLAVLGGIDIFDDAVQVLEDNGIPLVGGIPVGFATVNSPISFQFSSGSWGGDLALAYHITEELHAERVSIMYADFGPIADGAEWARRALIRGGVADSDVKMIPMPIVSEDILTPLTAANETDPDAIIALVQGPGCSAAVQAAHDIGVEAQIYFFGGCLDVSVVDEVGMDMLEGYIFNVENVVEGVPPDVTLYSNVIDRYGDGMESASAATVAFKSLINLYDQLVEIGADNLSSAALIENLRASVDHRSFMSPPYTCDGEQMGGKLPAICSPDQILTTIEDGVLRQITDWIDITSYVGTDA